jgi:hypothetical protein
MGICVLLERHTPSAQTERRERLCVRHGYEGATSTIVIAADGVLPLGGKTHRQRAALLRRRKTRVESQTIYFVQATYSFLLVKSFLDFFPFF